MDIWQTANPTDGSGPGWLGRWLDATGDDPMRAISVGATLPPLLRGDRESATAITAATDHPARRPDFERRLRGPPGPGPGSRPAWPAWWRPTGPGLPRGQGPARRARTPSAAPSTELGGAGGRRAPPGQRPSLAGQLGIVAALIKAGAPHQGVPGQPVQLRHPRRREGQSRAAARRARRRRHRLPRSRGSHARPGERRWS